MRRISATEAAREFSELLNQVRYRGESFIITRNGEDVCQLGPVKKPFTLGELKKLLQQHPWDEDFAGDLEQVHQHQGTLPEDPWKS